MPPTPAVSRLRLVPILLGQGFGLLCGVIGVKLNSHLVPPEILGVYGVFMTFAPIGMWVVHAGLVKFVARHWAGSANRPALAREIVSAWARRLPWLALLAGAAAGSMAPLIDRGWFVLWLALFGAATFLALTSLAQVAIQAERAHWRDFTVAVSSSLSRTFAPPLLFIATGGIAASLWLGFLGHAVLTAVVGLLVMQRYWRRTGVSAGRELTAVYEGPLFMVLAAAAWAVTSLTRWIVAWRFGETEAGYFTLIGGAAVIIATMFGTALMQYFQPGFFALGDSDARAALARRVDLAVAAYLVAALASLAAFAAVAPHLVGPLISPRYAAGLRWLLPAGCFAVATTTALFYHSMLLAGRREKACGAVDLATAGLLGAGCLLAVAAGETWFSRWLLLSPVVPLVLTRPLARHHLFRLEPVTAPAPIR